jgi:hypothetical protein
MQIKDDIMMIKDIIDKHLSKESLLVSEFLLYR